MNPSESDEQPFVARLVQSETESEAGGDSSVSGGGVGHADSPGSKIRRGSPFRVDPAFPVEKDSLSPSYADLGPFRYTAMGAASAAVLVLIFAGFGTWWFPAGGLLVAVLGAVLSIIGLFARSKFRLASSVSLVLHVGFFMLSYVRTLA